MLIEEDIVLITCAFFGTWLDVFLLCGMWGLLDGWDGLHWFGVMVAWELGVIPGVGRVGATELGDGFVNGADDTEIGAGTSLGVKFY